MATEISSIGKIAALRQLFENTGFKNEHTVTLTEKGECCESLKIMLEGIDFDLTYTPLKHLGYKAVLYSLGEIYASLRTPVSISVNLGISRRFSMEEITSLWEGILAAVREHGIEHVSLDLNPSLNGLTIAVSACGVQRKGVIATIPSSKNMDLICLTGHLGAAYMGLHVLEREKVAFNGSGRQPDLSKYKSVVASYLSPEIKPDILKRFHDASFLPSRGYFITKGLGEAVLRLTEESGFGAKIYLDKIPISSKTFEMAQEIDIDPVTSAMNGGDDYQFIFTVPIEKHDIIRKEFQDYDIIGHLAKPEVGSVLVTPEGAEIPIKAQGYRGSQQPAES